MQVEFNVLLKIFCFCQVNCQYYMQTVLQKVLLRISLITHILFFTSSSFNKTFLLKILEISKFFLTAMVNYLHNWGGSALCSMWACYEINLTSSVVWTLEMISIYSHKFKIFQTILFTFGLFVCSQFFTLLKSWESFCCKEENTKENSQVTSSCPLWFLFVRQVKLDIYSTNLQLNCSNHVHVVWKVSQVLIPTNTK